MHFAVIEKESANKICIVLNVQSPFVSHIENLNYSQLKEVRQQAWTDAILPMARYIRDELNYQLVPDYEDDGVDLRLGFDTSHITTTAAILKISIDGIRQISTGNKITKLFQVLAPVGNQCCFVQQ